MFESECILQDVSGMPTLCLPVEWGGFGHQLSVGEDIIWSVGQLSD